MRGRGIMVVTVGEPQPADPARRRRIRAELGAAARQGRAAGRTRKKGREIRGRGIMVVIVGVRAFLNFL